MGTFTGLYISCAFKKDLPEKVIEVLQYLFDEKGDDSTSEPKELPEHEFFTLPNWQLIGGCSSYYHTPMATSYLWFDAENSGRYYLTSRSDLKDYDNEIEAFMEWIMPYIREDDQFIGFVKAENSEPSLIYYGKDFSY